MAASVPADKPNLWHRKHENGSPRRRSDARQQRPSVAALAVILAIVPVMAVVLPMPTARCAAVITALPVAVIAVGIGVWCVVVIAIVAVVAVNALGTGVAVIATIAVGAMIDVVDRKSTRLNSSH